jgi:hypothetical protein
MCDGIALARSELPTELIGRHGLDRLSYTRGGEPEFRFLHRHERPQLPIWRDGQLQVARWGNGLGQSRFLPRSGWTWQTSIDDGDWRNLDAVLVDIPASLALDTGVWYRVRQGLRGLVVADERGIAVVYVICEPASHYYSIMTRNSRMPVFIMERI